MRMGAWQGREDRSSSLAFTGHLACLASEPQTGGGRRRLQRGTPAGGRQLGSAPNLRHCKDHVSNHVSSSRTDTPQLGLLVPVPEAGRCASLGSGPFWRHGSTNINASRCLWSV